ncbi:sigma-70 family RNA polymerase sigma factor [Glycomyces algeriensis]|uniref:RNA polymerase sigma factor n=1 Tax=Glycomyces algeriensis TaxID=256037 RepID=A0A9W6LIG0_9ACTN|nr:sigma-70 family RNA polymerase sigma factor [Glycomyces algeriensis]MDA1365445.1 sigma-70 family RNA polymerase sigma factor [Glycomyces algeriensis]MDR7351131.1 RNA polymerase sigma-70 factor (ECF subfamily) [Glycomyces algeriensis]GLI43844.1 RNA polymerase sigma factor [Glycomyces algeriensis]
MNEGVDFEQVQRFEEHRDHVRAVAFRMLGSTGEADDAVQEAWMRFARTDTADVENLRGWLTTVVSRICLNLLRSRRHRQEDALDGDLPLAAGPGAGGDPELDAVMADSVGLALQVVLDALGPAERVAFVLHDLFGVPFDRIAPVLDRTTEATRQLASRARRRVREGRARAEADRDARQRKSVVEAFLAAAHEGRFEDLLAVLDPNILVVADAEAVATGFAGREVIGASAVAAIFNGQAKDAVTVLVDGLAGAMWAPGGAPRSVLSFAVVDGRVVSIEIMNAPDTIAALELAAFED